MNNKLNEVIDIYSKGEYPSCALSNFAEYEFYVDGVKCASMEGFLQSLKFRSVKKQNKVCRLSGVNAKNSSKHTFAQLRWRVTQNLYWQGRKYKRDSDEYQLLLDKAYKELSKNSDFLSALKATGDSKLAHSIGTKNSRKTVLTEYEFIERLTKISNGLKTGEALD